MESLILNLQSEKVINNYINENHLVKYERGILNEILTAINESDSGLLSWFNGFGTSLRHITMNLYAYRKQLEFGFTEISFDQYGWFLRPEFLDREDLIFGNPDRYSEHSIIHLGRGIYHIWTYSLNYSYGMAGGGSFISVYDKHFKNRQDALTAGLNELKEMMSSKVGNSDNSNYNQSILTATLKDIAKFEVSMIQLSLF
ncbi:hypothetical protein [Daejeonella sp. JGW-45]|uniref:hypothetical protein n=1 Tax=Daejeonella sp. JGW-45 TaxID=3034148 RepID=UPI0023EAFE90|nr:hypothetical protein [Daejeonella sp. JGW-45]